MQTHIRRIENLSDLNYIEVCVSFYDEDTVPQTFADVSVFLKHDPTKNRLDDIKNEAVIEAMRFLHSIIDDHTK